jgi:hypothetical protein
MDGLDQLTGPALVAQLEAQAPWWWPPGTAFACHAVPIGTILGEHLRRATGETLGTRHLGCGAATG